MQGFLDTERLIQIWSHKTGMVYRRYPQVQTRKKIIAWRNGKAISTHFQLKSYLPIPVESEEISLVQCSNNRQISHNLGESFFSGIPTWHILEFVTFIVCALLFFSFGLIFNYFKKKNLKFSVGRNLEKMGEGNNSIKYIV